MKAPSGPLSVLLLTKSTSRATCGRLQNLNVLTPSWPCSSCSSVRHGRPLMSRVVALLCWTHLLVVSLAPVAFGQFGKVEAPVARVSAVSSTVFSLLCAFTKAQFILTFVFLAHTHWHTYIHTRRSHFIFHDQLWIVVFSFCCGFSKLFNEVSQSRNKYKYAEKWKWVVKKNYNKIRYK